MDKTGGILDLHWNITAVTQYISQQPEESALVETVDSPPQKITLLLPSAQDLVTKEAAELTHALLHQQPAGPF
jgi:hypothetical protein